MHRQFITYQGRPLVVGEEDDLLTIPEPGIEVNEILGSEEVTEKIAEDVQVGDFLYKTHRGFDIERVYCPPYHALPMIKDGELYSVGGNLQYGPGLEISKFDGSDFKFVKSFIDNYQTDYTDYAAYGNQFDAFQPFTTSSNNTFIFGSQIMDPFLRIVKVRDDLNFEHITSGPIKGPDYRYYNPANHTYGSVYRAEAIEHEGKIHLAMRFVRSVTSSDQFPRNMATFTFDENTYEIVETSIDTSAFVHSNIYPSAQQDSPKIVKYGNDIWMIVSHDNILFNTPGNIERWAWSVYKWNSSTSNWDYIQRNTNGTSGGVNAVDLFVTSSGDFYLLSIGSSVRADLWKFNDSTQLFELQDVISTVATTGSCFMFESNGSLYFIDEEGSSTSSITQLYKFDESTSSISSLGAGINEETFFPFYNKPILGASKVSKVIYNDELYMVLADTADLSTRYFKWNPTTEIFERISRCRVAHSGQTNQSRHDLRTIDYNGSSLVFQAVNNTYLYLSKYETSGDAAGSFTPMGGVDINPNINRGLTVVPYESGGTLYALLTGYVSPYVALFELDSTDNTLKKLDAGFIDVNPVGRAFASNYISFSGTNFVAIAHSNNTTYPLHVYTVDGSSFTLQASSLSGTPPGSVGYNCDFIEYNGDLFLTAACYVANQESRVCWKFDPTTSSWGNSLSFSSLLYDSATYYDYMMNSKFFELSGNLHILQAHSENAGTLRAYQYDGSGFNEIDFKLPTPPRDGSQSIDIKHKDGYLYLFHHNGASNMPVNLKCFRRDPSNGTWETLRVQSGRTDSGIALLGVTEFDNSIQVHHDASRSFQYGINYMSRLSEFAGESVWSKDTLHQLDKYLPEATGIALESGSKGDTIRIQKVRR
jgi:hypothetical protein